MRQVFPGHVRDFSGQIWVREKCEKVLQCPGFWNNAFYEI